MWPMLVSWTAVGPRRWRLFLVLFLVRMWRLKAWPRLTVPPGRTRKRFLAPLLVFILGMTAPYRLPGWAVSAAALTLREPAKASASSRRRPNHRANPSKHSRLRLLLGRQHHDHLAAFQLGHVLHHRHIGQLVADPLQQAHADVLVGDLAATEPQGHLALVTVFGDEAAQVAHLDRVVAFVGARAELHF